MKLTEWQREDLKSLVGHRGFKILEMIKDDKEQQLFSKFKSLSLWDTKVIEDIVCSQNVLSGMEYLITTAKGKSQGIGKKDSE